MSKVPLHNHAVEFARGLRQIGVVVAEPGASAQQTYYVKLFHVVILNVRVRMILIIYR
jgi:hypothetical protein